MLSINKSTLKNNIYYATIFIIAMAISGISHANRTVPPGVTGIDENPLTLDKFNSVIQLGKGCRPLPETYLHSRFIHTHLREFDGGASRLVDKSTYNKYGVGKPDAGKTEFVSTKENIDKILRDSGGEKDKIAKRLGIPSTSFSGQLVRIDFRPTTKYKPKMPSGNECGANAQWQPGGKLPDGDLEAVIETKEMQEGVDYTVSEITE